MKAVYYGQEVWQSADYDKNKYGIPELKKYPMPDREHVKSAIRFFNYVSPQYERELAENIIKRINEYHMTDISVGPDNRFGKYWNGDALVHSTYYGLEPYNPYTTAQQHGIIGMKWGVWNEETRARYLGLNRRKGTNADSPFRSRIGSKYNRKSGDGSGETTIGRTKLSSFNRKNKEYESTIKEIEDDAKQVNGGMMAALFANNRDQNCAYCTTAYELRRRGYDVKAAEAVYGVDLLGHPDLMFKGAKSHLLVDNTDYKKDKDGLYILDKYGNKQMSFSSKLFKTGGITKQQFNQIEAELVKQGEGARGNIFGFFVGSAYAGHSMAYEIVNGKLCIIDAQVGTVNDGSSILKSPYQDLKDFREVHYIRTDNLKVNENLIGNFVVDSSTKTKVDPAKVAKTGLALLSWFVPGAGLAYYAVDATDNISRAKERSQALDRLYEKGY